MLYTITDDKFDCCLCMFESALITSPYGSREILSFMDNVVVVAVVVTYFDCDGVDGGVEDAAAMSTGEETRWRRRECLEPGSFHQYCTDNRKAERQSNR